MKLEKLLLSAILASLLLAMGLFVACGDDDDDDSGSSDDDAGDDDAGDDDAGDDDGGGAGAAYDECVSFFTDCWDIPEVAADMACSYINDYDVNWNACLDQVFADYFSCLENLGCDSYDVAGIQGCAEDASLGASDC